MTKSHVFPGVADDLEREAVPTRIVDYIHGMLLPYPVTWDRVNKAITSHASNEAVVSMPNSFLSTEELSEFLHVSRVTVFRYMKAGKIRAYKLGRRNLFSLREVVDALKGVEVANV